MRTRVGWIVAAIGAWTVNPSMAEAAVVDQFSDAPVAWIVALMGVVAAAFVAWRYHRLHSRLEHVMAETEARLGELRDHLEAQTGALREAGERLINQQRMIEDLRQTDPLTGLWTRQHVLTQLGAHGARALRSWVAWNRGVSKSPPKNADLLIFIVGLDQLEAATAALGSEVVDGVLREFADVLRATSRTTDVLSRWGESEFMVVRSGAARDSVRELAERLRESVATHVFHPDGKLELSTTCSIGFSEHPLLTHAPDALGWEGVIALADAALAAARRTGRDGWVGVVGDAATPSDGLPELLADGPAALVEKGRLGVVSSFDEETPIRWTED